MLLLAVFLLTSCRPASISEPPRVVTPTYTETQLVEAAYAGKLDLVRSCLKSGLSPNTRKALSTDSVTGTALYWAAQQGHVEVVSLLLSSGAKVDESTSPGLLTPLMAAAKSNHLQVVALLLEQGAKPNTVDENGSTALIHAAAAGHIGIVQALINSQADITITDKKEHLDAHAWALRNNHLAVAELLKVKSPPELIIGNMVEAWVENYKQIQVATTYVSESQTYILVSQGLRESLGYGAEIINIEETPLQTEVIVKFTYPQPGKPYLAELNTPYDLAVIESTKPVVFKTEDPHELVPTLVDVPASFSLYSETYWLEYVPNSQDTPVPGNILLGVTLEELNHRDEDAIIIEGIARIFEAYVEYDFLDKDGKPHSAGYVHAASAAPFWGYFRIELDSLPEDISAIRVYSTSAKDGSIQDLVVIRP